MIFSALQTIIQFVEGFYEVSNQMFTADFILGMLIFATAINVGVYVAAFVFRGVALNKMAKNAGIKESYLAFIPFAAYVLLGKMRDDGALKMHDGSPRPNAPLNVVIAIVSSSLIALTYLILDILYGFNALFELISIFGQGKAATLNTFTGASLAPTMMIIFFSVILTYVLLFVKAMIYSSVFKAYAPEKSNAYFIIGLIGEVVIGQGLLFAIMLFIVRNNKKQSYRDYINRKMASFGRPPFGNNGFYGNFGNGFNGNNGYGRPPYQNPYNNNNGFNGAGDNQTQKRADDNPFEEFPDDNSSNDDDLFN
ncbi:MAG: hypothetical protein J6N93_07510 [Clostridia bacterium]|nr:hypothetical protein [Clostridia bacterium]